MFTVVIPLYNKESTIEETLKSVLNQTVSNFDIIVVNDGSTDRSREHAARLTDSRIKIFDQSNKGISAARNLAIRHSPSPYIATLDADDIWLPEYLEEQTRMITDFPEAKMWGTAWDSFGIQKRYSRDHGLDSAFRGYVDDYFTMNKKGHLFLPSATVVERQAISDVGLYDENIRTGEDLDLYFRMLLQYRAAFCNNPLMLFNTGIPNRHTKRATPIHYWYFYNMKKYEVDRRENPVFRKYFDHLVLLYMYSYRLNGQFGDQVDEILTHIDFTLQPRRWRWLYKFPSAYKLYRKVRQKP
mgnify:FL=1